MSKLKKVTIVVKDGRVENVYGSDKDIDITILDLDTQDENEYQILEQEVKNIKKEQVELA